MKKLAVTVVALALTGLMGQATELDWGSGVPVAWAPGETDGSGWVLAIYQDGGDGILGLDGDAIGLDFDVSTGNSLGDEGAPIHQSAVPGWGGNAGSGFMWYETTPDITAGAEIFTVVFNNSTMADADMYLIVDRALFPVPDAGSPPGPKSYDPLHGGAPAQDDWQAVPEPSSLALMGLGVAALVARRFRKK